MTDNLPTASTKPKLPTIPPPPAAKSHPYNPTSHPYRPNLPTRRIRKHRKTSCRRCCCLTCFWSILILIAILLLATTAAAGFYVLYTPHRPTFSVTSLKISTFNLTTTPPDDTTYLTTKVNLTISAKNSNKKIIFFYDPISISVQSSEIEFANGTFSNFTNLPASSFVIHTTLGVKSRGLDTDDLKSLNTDLKRKRGLPIGIVMDTMLGVKMENMKTKKIGIRVKCEDIHGTVPKGKPVIPAVASITNADCKVDLRVKIWKWTF